jgi:hypothetical protein
LKELPTRFEECDIDHLIELIGTSISMKLEYNKQYTRLTYQQHPAYTIASMLTRLITHNDQIPFTSTSLTRFHSRSPPAISISDYLRRIYKYTNPEPICLILILNYIDRICKNLINFTICSLTVHRFCITSVTVGSKFICDSFYSNSRYAKVGGISLTEINLLEREFLLAIDYRLSVGPNPPSSSSFVASYKKKKALPTLKKLPYSLKKTHLFLLVLSFFFFPCHLFH